MQASDQFAFKDLSVWKKSLNFARHVIEAISQIEDDRKHYRLFEQIESSATSVSANIAEGKGRYSKKEFRQFCFIARGSLYETVTFLNIFHNLSWISKDKLIELENEATEIAKMLNGLINKI